MNYKEWEIYKIKNEYDCYIYHVSDGECIQEFDTQREASQFTLFWLPYINKMHYLELESKK